MPWQMSEMLRGSGTTLLLTTHHLEEAEWLSSRVGIMKGGRLACEGSIAELLALVPGEAVALIESEDEGAVARRAGELGCGLRRYAGRLGSLLPQQLSLRNVVDALCDVEITSVSLQRVSLEHAYLEVNQAE